MRFWTRREFGLSQNDAAKKLDIMGPVLGRYERGENNPSIEMVKKIAELYQVSLDYLLTNKAKIIKDKKMSERIYELDSLPIEEKNYITKALDAMLRDAKTKKAYSN